AKASGNVDPDEFDETQAAWKEFATKEASLHATLVSGGSMEPMVYADTLTDLTKTRLEQIKWWADLEEGDT
ncbi:MAG: lysozyme inhibitor LprI family protein, partial [Bosea sp. (in: a-proteobacteria)]|nr:lysozyme inhibitor LprI family protein [Bosea sp. (in: a-proteobacteria)]